MFPYQQPDLTDIISGDYVPWHKPIIASPNGVSQVWGDLECPELESDLLAHEDESGILRPYSPDSDWLIYGGHIYEPCENVPREAIDYLSRPDTLWGVVEALDEDTLEPIGWVIIYNSIDAVELHGWPTAQDVAREYLITETQHIADCDGDLVEVENEDEMGRIGSGELIGIVPEGEVYAAVYCYTGYPNDPQLSVRWWIRPAYEESENVDHYYQYPWAEDYPTALYGDIELRSMLAATPDVCAALSAADELLARFTEDDEEDND